jgi:peptidoglycan hydrolase CwlO-like protein
MLMGCSNLRLSIGFFWVLVWVTGVSGPVLAEAPPPAGAFENVQDTLAAILSAIENLQTAVDKLTDDVDKLRDDVDSLTDSVDSLTDDVDSLSTNVSNLQTAVDKPYWNK